MHRKQTDLLSQLENLNAQELRRLLVEHLTRQKLGLYWEHNAIERDQALNANLVLPRLVPDWSQLDGASGAGTKNLIIEGDNYDSLRLLQATHRGKIRVIYIDPPYNTGNKDWVYNDNYVGQHDRWRHSLWLEFMYRRLSLARDLLTPDGVILVSINDENRARLELLMDDVFPGRRVGSFVWRSRTGGNDTKGAFFSDNHEHVLVYANPGFRFSGDEKSYSMYKYQEGDRLYRLSDLTKAHDFRERPNTYYPIFDPETHVYYPCNSQRVWAYASRDRIKDGQKIRGDTIEDLIDKKLIWFPSSQRVEVFDSKKALLEAIAKKDVPMSGTTPLLFAGMPDLDFWVGKQIGYGRPAFKRFKEGLKNENQPISSWLTPKQESDTVIEGLNMPIVGTTEEGSKELKKLMGDKAFPYPKPPSLMKALLAQATQPGDIVLDFFAGSGTTGHAVLELNAEDGGNRSFILCSSTEATTAEPSKNLSRDVCAERVRRVMLGNDELAGLGGAFAYLQLDLIEQADLNFEANADHAFQLLCLREARAVKVPAVNGAVQQVAGNTDVAVLLCSEVTPKVIKQLAEWPAERLAVYSPRPDTVRERLESVGVAVNSYSLTDALMRGQTTVRNAQATS